MDNLKAAQILLQKKGVRASTIRVNVLAYLLSHPIHPTVEQIYQALRKTMLTLSKTTIYNTLDLFIEHKLIRPISIDEKEMRYDANTLEHGHFQCLDCNTITDLTIQCTTPDLAGFRILARNVYYHGICAKCQTKREE